MSFKIENKMKTSIIDLHLSDTHFSEKRIWRLGHCQMVAWLINNFRKIKSGDVLFKDYLTEASSNGIMHYNEESFNVFKEQDYV